MTNIAEIVKVAADAASSDWRVSAGMIAAGVLIGLGHWTYKRMKGKPHEPITRQ